MTDEIRTAYFELQNMRLDKRLQNVREIVRLFDTISGIKTSVLLSSYMPILKNIAQFERIVIKSQKDLDTYSKQIVQFEIYLQTLYGVAVALFPYIEDIFAQSDEGRQLLTKIILNRSY